MQLDIVFLLLISLLLVICALILLVDDTNLAADSERALILIQKILNCTILSTKQQEARTRKRKQNSIRGIRHGVREQRE